MNNSDVRYSITPEQYLGKFGLHAMPVMYL